MGVHVCNLTEIESVFVSNDQRRLIWRGFLAFIELVKPLPELNNIYVDDGFVTDKAHPKDVDIIIEYPDSPTHVRMARGNVCLRTRNQIKDVYKVDVLECFSNSTTLDMRHLFQLLRPEEALAGGVPAGTMKGILRISLR